MLRIYYVAFVAVLSSHLMLLLLIHHLIILVEISTVGAETLLDLSMRAVIALLGYGHVLRVCMCAWSLGRV